MLDGGQCLAEVSTTLPSCPEGTVALAGGTFTPHGFDWGLQYYHAYSFPKKTRAVQPFCMDRTEVTVAAYRACVTAGACSVPFKSQVFHGCNWEEKDREKHPINCVDWHQATAYCGWAGKRLPTSEEWSWTARGGDRASTYPWGEDEPDLLRANACGSECVEWLRQYPWHKTITEGFTSFKGTDGWPTTAPVGSFPLGATPSGIRDLVGNVGEWTSTTTNGWTKDEMDAYIANHPEHPLLDAGVLQPGGFWSALEELAGSGRESDAAVRSASEEGAEKCSVEGWSSHMNSDLEGDSCTDWLVSKTFRDGDVYNEPDTTGFRCAR